MRKRKQLGVVAKGSDGSFDFIEQSVLEKYGLKNKEKSNSLDEESGKYFGATTKVIPKKYR
ncbi:hypothetical protein, partial [Pseudomonas sp. 2995-1]|uniref:hypothetical protein n=1 Tax=Pseudomonas sp. 2995-1 TaxID=1712679 RepID=UPI00117B18D7